MKIKKAILEKDEFGKMELPAKTYWVDWKHEGMDNPKMIIGECTVEEDLENKCYNSNIRLFDKDEKFVHEDGTIDIAPGYGKSKIVMEMLQNKMKLYPAIQGKILEKDENGIITKFELLSVGICESNIDKTIPPLELEEDENI